MVTAEPVRAKRRNAFGKPDAGDPHVRFDEGGGTSNDAPPLLDWLKNIRHPSTFWTHFVTRANTSSPCAKRSRLSAANCARCREVPSELPPVCGVT